MLWIHPTSNWIEIILYDKPKGLKGKHGELINSQGKYNQH